MERGELARAVMECLWREPDGLSAASVVDRLSQHDGRRLAVTTVLTVLERLRHKGLVDRVRQGKSYLYTAVADRESLVVEAMTAALADSSDRTLALSRFVDAMTPQEQATLRAALGGQP
ncbi:MAG: BlaI/MecI/CopY family transcriptional regulator [Actinobacteria bacterium]|nr:BlaI/MecI/CopY family transcriptional regulator [Actinomycetota bacterium]